MALKRVNAVIEGLVQGVFFRASTMEKAKHLALTGWVRNRSDGSVETEFQGDEEEVSRMISWLHTGPPHSIVKNVVAVDLEIIDLEQDFLVKY